MTAGTMSLREAPRLHARTWFERDSRHVLWVGFALIGAQLLWHAWVAYHSWWFQDDFTLMDRVLQPGGHSLRGLFEGYDGHLTPGRMYLAWLFVKVDPYNFAFAALSMLLVQALAALGLLRFLVVAFGQRWGVLAPLALYLASPFTVQGTVWWVVGIGMYMTMAALAWSMASQVNYLRTGRRSSALFAAVWLGIGLLFSERVLLVVGAMAFVTVAYFTEGRLGTRIHQVWQRYRFSLLANVLLGMGYLALYASHVLNFSPKGAGSAPIGPELEQTVLRSWATGIFGGPFGWRSNGPANSFADPPSVVVVLCLLLLGLVIRELVRTRVYSLRALFLPAYFLACDLVLTATAVGSMAGPGVGAEFRYISEMSMVTPMALALATMPVRGATEQLRSTRTSGLFDRWRPATLACVAVVLLGVFSTATYVHRWNVGRAPGDSWMRNLLASAAALPRGTAVIDTPGPEYVALPVSYPANTVSRLLRPVQSDLQFTTAGSENLYIAGDDGRLVPVDLEVLRHGFVEGDPSCRSRVAAQQTEVRLDGPVIFGGLWVRVGYLATGDGAIRVSAGGASHSTEIHHGVHYLYFRAGDKRFDTIQLGPITGPAVLCTSDVVVGRPQAQMKK